MHTNPLETAAYDAKKRSDLNRATQLPSLISYPLLIMLSIFFALILLLNVVLALPSPRPESSVSVSNIRRITITGEMHEAIEVRGKEAAL